MPDPNYSKTKTIKKGKITTENNIEIDELDDIFNDFDINHDYVTEMENVKF